MRKIKYVCTQKDGKYQAALYADGELLDCAFDTETWAAEKFFNAFAPQSLTAQCTEQYGENFVLVFRTDDQQMQEFDALLSEHGAFVQ